MPHRVIAPLCRRVRNILIAIDQLAWVLLTLGDGHPDETISAAAWRLESQGKLAGRLLRPLIDLLFLPIERDHCRKSHASELARTQLPPAYRTNHP
ncbi:pseudouridine synthase [Pseudothauera hydrothermalis]|uniref:pseudouridine synthase n=1 Tax=Pseudothauera hydrothermalis TaxID=2184083 RepID=UPI000E08F114|nr:pseudouridine synthase [Pseudothauera hydrothermalis]